MFKSEDIVTYIKYAKLKISFICDTYDAKVNELLEALSKISKPEEARSLFNEFIINYTMVPQLWFLWLKIECYNHKITDKESIQEHNIRLIGNQHFTLDMITVSGNEVFLFCCKTIFSKLDDLKLSPTAVERFERLFLHPFDDNNGELYKFDKLSTYPISNTIISGRKQLSNFVIYFDYATINKWLEGLKNIYKNDYKFIVDTIEIRLSYRPYFDELWKLYINYLKDNNDIQILKVYSRYCRLFINDFQMIKNYEAEIERMEKLLSFDAVYDSWIDLIEFKRVFYPTTEDLQKIIKQTSCKLFIQHFKNQTQDSYKRFKPIVVNFCQNATISSEKVLFKWETIQQQNFSLPSSLIRCILDITTIKIRQKLQKSCKYFFYKSKKPICHRLKIFSDNAEMNVSRFQKQALNITVPSFDLRNLNGYIISHYLYIDDNIYDKNITKAILLQNVEVNVKYLYLSNQDLTFKELTLLKSKNLEDLSINNLIITDYKEKSVEKIMQVFSYSECIRFDGYPIFFEETQVSTNFEDCDKIERILFLKNVDEKLDPVLFSQFILNCCLNNSLTIAQFSIHVPENVKQNFQLIAKQHLQHMYISVR